MGDSTALKVVLLGMKNVGKTSLFNRYVYDEFGKTSMTIGAYFATKQCDVDGRPNNLAIWDTAGEEKFDSLTSFYCRGAKAAIVCYDVTSWSSFESLARWCKKLEDAGSQNCSIVFAGNKLDIVESDPSKRAVRLAEVERFASERGALVVEVSAKTGAHVSEVFEKVVAHYLSEGHPGDTSKNGIHLKSTKRDGPCC